MEVIHNFMRQENVDSHIKVKVSNYIEYLHKKSNDSQKQKEN
jgi:hypothetical protein